MQIRLSKNNTKLLKSLIRIYKKTCPDYDLSVTKQGNLLLAGRLGLAVQEAEKELQNHACRIKS